MVLLVGWLQFIKSVYTFCHCSGRCDEGDERKTTTGAAVRTLIVMAATRVEMRRKLAEWHLSLVTMGMKVNTVKTKVTVSIGDRGVISGSGV